MRRHRPGITLLEVLAAIFIMGIGTLAILTLFPLGALNMARALKDDRCGTIAVNAHAMAVARNLDVDANIVAALNWDRAPPGGFLQADPNGLGYPIMVDPYFRRNGVPAASFNVMGAVAGAAPNRTLGVPRVQPLYIQNDPNPSDATDRWFSFTDDLTFETNGRPKQIGLQLERQGYYTFAYLLRRNPTAVPTSTQVTVIVYSGRGVQSPAPEQVYRVNPANANGANAGATTFTLGWTPPTPPPAIRRGTWVMDVSYVERTRTTGGTPGTYGFLHGDCYRVMDASQVGTTNTMQVEIQSGLRQSLVRYMVVLENSVEVFERGLLK